MGVETLICDFSPGRQEVADETWMRPVGGQRDLAGLAHRQDLQLAGALQFQVEAEIQFGVLLRVQCRQHHVHALAQPADLTAGHVNWLG